MLTNSVEHLKGEEGQAIYLVSHPGDEKLRAHTELQHHIQHGDLNLIDGRCHSYGQNTAYHTFIDMTKHLCAIDSDDMADTATHKFVESLPLLLGQDRVLLSDMARNAIVLIRKLLDLDLSNIFDVALSDMSAQRFILQP